MSGGDKSSAGLTPLMRQYHQIKSQHPDKILFFRMGDFYEMFGDDAVKAAPMLGIALTSRSHGTAERIPLAGVPYHSADRYLARLIAHGEKVVIVEQVEDPKEARGLVKRDIVEILTPGTASFDLPGEEHRPTRLVAVYSPDQRRLGAAALDFASGEFTVDEGTADDILPRLRLLEPSELIHPSGMDIGSLLDALGMSAANGRVTEYGDWNFDYRTAQRELCEHFGTSTLDGFGVGRIRLGIAAAGAVFRYLRENHRERLAHLSRLSPTEPGEQMLLDFSTVRNLELVRNIADSTEENSLFSVVNQCASVLGGRRLRESLLHPFRSRERIEARLSGVTELVKNRNLAHDLREELRQLADIERLAGRLGTGVLNPRQMAAVADSLKIAGRLRELLTAGHGGHLCKLRDGMPMLTEPIERITAALVDDPPPTALKGDIFRRGHSERLDALNDSIKDARGYIGSLQEVERKRTGINSLKVGFNKVFGYYLEVTKANAALVPEGYIRKQTLVNAERYITNELKEKEDLILAAEEKIFKLEAELYDELVTWLAGYIGQIIDTGQILAEIDLVAGLAELAVKRGYGKPQLFDDTRLVIAGGRHPVIEHVLPAGSFVANDVALGEDRDRLVILTGPNMSGKSTYLRQIGLIVILAQIGSYVPADRAEIGLVDRVFTRVGALDNLARGQSTFLVEMVETANILHNATERSLILLDEVGRGTSTFDGLSIAWSAAEYINDHLNARTVFATHYHELTGMAALYPKVSNFQVSVKRWEDRVVFLHKIVPGGCDDSYGIEVARLAGLPRATLTRARQILRLLESGKFTQSELGQGLYREKIQPTLFDAPPSEIEAAIAESDPDNLTPAQAHELLRRLKDKLT